MASRVKASRVSSMSIFMISLIIVFSQLLILVVFLADNAYLICWWRSATLSDASKTPLESENRLLHSF